MNTIKKYIFHTDDGHGWLEIPVNEIPKSLLPQISKFSYRNLSTAYLEEDCDAPLIMHALNINNEQIEEQHKDESFVRRLPNFYFYNEEGAR